MKNIGLSGAFLRFFRSAILIDLSLAAIVWITGYVFGWRTPEAYGTALVWAGMGVILFASLAGIGGLSSRAEDAEAYSLTGSGNMSQNLGQLSEANRSSLGCFTLLVVSGIGLLMLGYLIPIILALLG